MPELLAPAGGYEAACAAFEYGADGVYLGLKQFSARDDAVNFSPVELSDIVGYARSFSSPRRVYLTLNTLIKENELPEIIRQLQLARDLRVDAVIVQDFGVVQLAKHYFPDITLHASTQMAVHNTQGVEALRELGVKRVIPARELTLKEIADICSFPEMEIEVFLHGALCYSYSGLCLFSAMEHGPSGNRGGCLYNCRNWFDPADAADTRQGGMPFAMKDLCLDKQLPDLLAAGVSSLKIEGRKKSPLYVATVVNYYRKLLDQSASSSELERLKIDVESVFHRPTTSLFIKKTRNPHATDTIRGGHQGTPVGTIQHITTNHVDIAVSSAGIQRYDGLQIEISGQSRPFGFGVTDLQRIDGACPQRTFEIQPGETARVALPADTPAGLVPGLTVYRSSSQDVKQRYKWHPPKPGLHRLRTPVDFTIELTSDTLTASGTVDSVQAEDIISGSFSQARNPEGTETAIRKAFGKLGETPFILNACEMRNPHALFAPASLLNDLRRELTAKLQQRLEEHLEHECRAITTAIAPRKSVADSAATRWILKTDRIELLTGFSDSALALADEIMIDISRDSLDTLACGLRGLAKRTTATMRLALPAVIRQQRMTDIEAKISWAREAGHTTWQIANISQLEMIDSNNHDVTADWPLYTWNSQAAALYKSLGLRSVTFSPEQTTADILTVLPTCPLPGTVIVHQDVPLFNSAVCAKASLDQACPGPAACDFENMTLRNSKGVRYTAINHDCETILIGENALSRENDLEALEKGGAGAFQVNLSWRDYTTTEAEAIWRRFTVRDPKTH